MDRNLSIHVGFYDKDHKDHDSAVLNMNRVLAKTAKITSNDLVLDAGCGIGGSTIWLAKNIRSNIIGININNNQIKIAKELAKKNNVNDMVKFYIKDYMNLDFPDNTFDVVWGLESICYAEDKKEFLSQAKKILKKDGRIIIADGFINRENLTNKEKKFLNKWLDGWAIPNLASVNEFQKNLEELGFKNIEFKDITKNISPSSKRMYLAGVSLYPYGKILEWIGIRNKTLTNNIIGAIYQYKVRKKNIGIYGIFYAKK
jgi:ubiquinone/menaquinone biosynthesis C-methylase UbiE